MRDPLLADGPAPGEDADLSEETGRIDMSVVIPVFNEEERIVSTVTKVSDHLRRQGKTYEVIVSDDGSRDGGPALVREQFAGRPEVKLIRVRYNRGKGAAVREGMLAARGGIIIFTDADLAYPVETIDICLEALRNHDVALGSRNLPASEIEATPPVIRRLAGVAFKFLVRRMVITGFSDPQCGFKGFRRQAGRDIFIHCGTSGFAFDVEVLALARLFGYSTAEVPVRLQVDSSDSTINLFSDPVKMAIELLAIKRRLHKISDSG